MQHARVILRFLLPTNQNATVSIHPTVRPLSHPAASLEPRGTPNQLRFFTARANMRREPEFHCQITHFVIVIPFVQTQVLRPAQRRPGSFYGNAFECLPRELEVVDVGARYGQSHRNTVRLGEQTSLGAGFASIRRVRAGFSPRPAVPWSSPRPYSAKTNSTPSVRRTLPIRLATVSGTRPPAPIPEIADAPLNSNRSPWRSTHSIGSRFAPRKESRPSHLDHSAGADLARAGLCSHAPATTAPQTPKTHPNTAIDSIASLHPPFRASMPKRIIDNLTVFGIGSKLRTRGPVSQVRKTRNRQFLKNKKSNPLRADPI